VIGSDLCDEAKQASAAVLPDDPSVETSAHQLDECENRVIP
jgi:hypothetical protein